MEAKATFEKTEEEHKMKTGQLERMIKNLKDGKRPMDNLLIEKKTALQDREEELKEAERKYNHSSLELKDVQTTIENGKKQYKEFKEQYDSLKAKLDSAPNP